MERARQKTEKTDQAQSKIVLFVYSSGRKLGPSLITNPKGRESAPAIENALRYAMTRENQ
jgi:hypothetical protein